MWIVTGLSANGDRDHRLNITTHSGVFTSVDVCAEDNVRMTYVCLCLRV